jgi:hypothetical protein
MGGRQERDEGAFSRTRKIVASPKIPRRSFPRSAVGMHTVPLRGTDHARETGDGYIATGAVILPMRVDLPIYSACGQLGNATLSLGAASCPHCANELAECIQAAKCANIRDTGPRKI